MQLLRMIPLCLTAFGTAAYADVPRVVTDMPVVQSLVAQVMGDLGSPEVLLQQGADVHSLQLRPSQARSVAEADLLFWVGPELTPWLESAVLGVGMAGRSVELLHAAGVTLRSYGSADAHEHHDAHDHKHDDHEHADEKHGTNGHEQGHDHSGTDPHAWLDPANARAWTNAIAAALAEQDSANAATYAANASTARALIDRAEAEVRRILAPARSAPIVVYHDAYGYFSAHFGVNIVGELELGDAGAPSAEKLAGLRETLLQDGATCIFPEAQYDPKLLYSVVEGTDVRIGAAIDPEGTSLAYGPDLYRALMVGLARAIADCVRAEG